MRFAPFFSNLTFFFVPHPKSDFFTLYLHNGMPIRNYRANIIRYFRKSVSLATKFISDDEKAYFSIIYPACRRVACPRKQLRVQLLGNACVRTFHGFGRTQYLPDRDDASLVFSNPALLSSVSDKTLNLNFMTYLQGCNVGSAAFVKILGERSTMGVTAQYAHYGTMDEITPTTSPWALSRPWTWL